MPKFDKSIRVRGSFSAALITFSSSINFQKLAISHGPKVDFQKI